MALKTLGGWLAVLGFLGGGPVGLLPGAAVFGLGKLIQRYQGKQLEEAEKLLDVFDDLVGKARELTAERLLAGGAKGVVDKGVKDLRLHVTNKQVDTAHKEMESDLTSRE